MRPEVLTSAAIALLFVAIHLFIGRLRKLDVTPRSGWLSFAGGTAVAYVFLHVLPEIAAHQSVFEDVTMGGGMEIDIAVYTIALAGLAVYYAVERWAKLFEDRARTDMHCDTVLWVHTASFAVYNVLIGYLLTHREDGGEWSLALYAVAMGLHFVTTDHGMRRDHSAAYDRVSRWVLSGAVLVGWALGWAVMLPEVVIGCLFAFLAGGVVLNVLKEELPAERESRIGPFMAGTIFYAGLLFAEHALA